MPLSLSPKLHPSRFVTSPCPVTAHDRLQSLCNTTRCRCRANGFMHDSDSVIPSSRKRSKAGANTSRGILMTGATLSWGKRDLHRGRETRIVIFPPFGGFFMGETLSCDTGQVAGEWPLCCLVTKCVYGCEHLSCVGIRDLLLQEQRHHH